NRQLPSADELLRTRKSRRANKARPGLFGAELCLRTHNLGPPIINQLYRERPARIRFEHNVRWFDVAMHHAARFRDSQRARSLLSYFQGRSEWHWSITPHTCFERFAMDKFHRIETLAVLLSVISHLSNVWVMNVRGCARFAQKTGSRIAILRDAPVDDFESYSRVQHCIASAVRD